MAKPKLSVDWYSDDHHVISCRVFNDGKEILYSRAEIRDDDWDVDLVLQYGKYAGYQRMDLDARALPALIKFLQRVSLRAR